MPVGDIDIVVSEDGVEAVPEEVGSPECHGRRGLRSPFRTPHILFEDRGVP